MQYDIFLFDNDLVEYQNSDEGKAVQRLLSWDDYDERCLDEGVTRAQFTETIGRYWDARNGDGLTFSDKEAQERGKESDVLEAALYAEQN